VVFGLAQVQSDLNNEFWNQAAMFSFFRFRVVLHMMMIDQGFYLLREALSVYRLS
jgi:hypothetical protein